MKKYISTVLFVFISFTAVAQVAGRVIEKFPVFPVCADKNAEELENCFYYNVQDFVFNNFKVPENLQQNNFKGTVAVLFEVDAKGTFKTLYVDAIDESLVAEAKRVFGQFPVIAPPTYNGIASYSKYTIKIAIPLKSAADVAAEKTAQSKNYTKADKIKRVKDRSKELAEYHSIVYHKFNEHKLERNLNIPF